MADKDNKIWMLLIVPDEFIWVLFMMALHCTTNMWALMVFVAPVRKKHFTPEFLQQFAEEHKKEYPESSGPDPTGNPDQGSGWYSKKWSLRDWYEYNSSVRAHANYTEALPMILLPAPIAAVYFPKPALAFIIGSYIGNLMYMFGYAKGSGTAMFKVVRPLGVMLRLLCALGNIICGIWASIEVIKYGSEVMD